MPSYIKTVKVAYENILLGDNDLLERIISKKNYTCSEISEAIDKDKAKLITLKKDTILLGEVLNGIVKYGNYVFISDKFVRMIDFSKQKELKIEEVKYVMERGCAIIGKDDWAKLVNVGVLDDKYQDITDDWISCFSEENAFEKYGKRMFSPKLGRLRHTTMMEFYGNGIVD